MEQKEQKPKEKIRQPIVTVAGHVDHGKTSILDSIRSSSVQEGEAGGITQKISFTSYPIEKLKAACPLIEKSGINLNIPGFLLIDTPGHAAFTNLRKRGGSLADLAVLVIDITEGIKPQTAEVIQILKLNKTPFIIALNKIDKITGWKKLSENLKDSVEMQGERIKEVFNEKFYTLVGSLQSYGLDTDLYYNITDFTKKISMVPCSAQTKEGIPELIMMLCGLSEKFLTKRLALNPEPKGVMLEVKKERGNESVEAILYDGELKRTDEIAVASLTGEPIITKIRILEEIMPLSSKFKTIEKVKASTGIRLQLIGPNGVSSGVKQEILPGMPFVKFKNNLKEITELFKKELGESIQTEKYGIVAKADSLGSLEALLVLLKQNNIKVVRAGIGDINKVDAINAKANLEINELDSVVVGFNVKVTDDAKEISSKIKMITDEVVYKIIEDLVEWRKEKQAGIEKERLMGLSAICKLEILPQYVFRNTKPAIFGVRVIGGKLVKNLSIINEDDEKVGNIKNIQKDRSSVDEAHEGDELAISIPNVNFERQLKNKRFLYTNLGESQFKKFKKNKDLLNGSEMNVLKDIAEIKRKTKSEWGI
ncbi:translation initiation factor IF-2 [Candidatus Pacearchaeota archaeon CG_4_9_14_0_2_um_filter_30_8]|nr:MAG: translation initiation factor IF-2 [Candidatus Pacearchaeota archaeon CG_4_9_14_0_2_um_filter_30_8]